MTLVSRIFDNFNSNKNDDVSSPPKDYSTIEIKTQAWFRPSIKSGQINIRILESECKKIGWRKGDKIKLAKNSYSQFFAAYLDPNGLKLDIEDSGWLTTKTGWPLESDYYRDQANPETGYHHSDSVLFFGINTKRSAPSDSKILAGFRLTEYLIIIFAVACLLTSLIFQYFGIDKLQMEQIFESLYGTFFT